MSAFAHSARMHDFYASNPQSPEIASGGTLKLNNLQGQIFTLDAGTYKTDGSARLGHRFFIVANGDIVLQNSAGTQIATIASGRTVEFLMLSATDGIVVGGFVRTGIIDLPLASWREVVSNDIPNTAAIGGQLTTDSTPAFEYTNGDTTSTHRLLWAAGNQDPITRQFTLPPDYDSSQPLLINMVGLMSADANTPVMDCDAYFGASGSKVEDASDAFDENVTRRVITIAASDYVAPPENAQQTVTVELTPGAHAADTLTIYNIWASYTRKF